MASLIVNWQHVVDITSGTQGSYPSSRMARQIDSAPGSPGTFTQTVAAGRWQPASGQGWAPTVQNSDPIIVGNLHNDNSEGLPPPTYPYEGNTYAFFFWQINVQVWTKTWTRSLWTIWPGRTPPPYQQLVPPSLVEQADAAGGGKVTIWATAEYVWDPLSGGGPNAAMFDAIDATLTTASGDPVSPPFDAIYDDFVLPITSNSPLIPPDALRMYTDEANNGNMPTSDLAGPVDVTAMRQVGPMEPPWNTLGLPGNQPGEPPSGPPAHPTLNFYYWIFMYLDRAGDPSVGPNNPLNGAQPAYDQLITVQPGEDLYVLAVYGETPPMVFPAPPVRVVGPGVRQAEEPYLVLASSDAGMVLVPRGGGSPIGPGDPARARIAGLLRTAYAVVVGVEPSSVLVETSKKGER